MKIKCTLRVEYKDIRSFSFDTNHPDPFAILRLVSVVFVIRLTNRLTLDGLKFYCRSCERKRKEEKAMCDGRLNRYEDSLRWFWVLASWWGPRRENRNEDLIGLESYNHKGERSFSKLLPSSRLDFQLQIAQLAPQESLSSFPAPNPFLVAKRRPSHVFIPRRELAFPPFHPRSSLGS
jgi:hypothetical protein